MVEALPGRRSIDRQLVLYHQTHTITIHDDRRFSINLPAYNRYLHPVVVQLLVAARYAVPSSYTRCSMVVRFPRHFGALSSPLGNSPFADNPYKIDGGIVPVVSI